MEGSNAIFECETEDENGPVEWYKYDDTNTDDTENEVYWFKIAEKMKNIDIEEHGLIYKLTIKHAKCKDSGHYAIEKNDFHSKAELQVTGIYL